MDSQKHHIYDKGMLNLIRQKLTHGSPAKEIEHMLVRAGFLLSDIIPAIQHVANEMDDSLAIAQNDFLPPLKKKVVETVQRSHITDEFEKGVKQVYDHVVKPIEQSSIGQIVSAQMNHRGLFKGRLRRKDFIIGMLFFFGLGFVYFALLTTWIQLLMPSLWGQIVAYVSQDMFGSWLLAIPVIFAPITVMMLSLITRRLHNLGLPGWIAFLYLFTFVSPFGAWHNYPLLGMHTALLSLFVVMISKKGHPAPNTHGAHPRSTGSFFNRILGRE
jgi:uncharacterized membrane protein YhaH (DUF805 family)